MDVSIQEKPLTEKVLVPLLILPVLQMVPVTGKGAAALVLLFDIPMDLGICFQ